MNGILFAYSLGMAALVGFSTSGGRYGSAAFNAMLGVMTMIYLARQK